MRTDLKETLPKVVEIARAAGKKTLEVRERAMRNVNYKEDRSPVTEADLAAHRLIQDALARLSELPVLSEESADIPYETRASWSEYWIVDPLDGTREFIEGRDDFTVNIGLVFENAPVLGVVHLPVPDATYYAHRGGGAYKAERGGEARAIHARTTPGDKPVVAVSLSHANKATQDFLDLLGPHELVRRGSIVKTCMVSEGAADLYARFGNTSEWDTAAGQCVLEEAGGRLTDMDGAVLRYNTKASLLNPPFMSAAPSATDWQSILKRMPPWKK